MEKQPQMPLEQAQALLDELFETVRSRMPAQHEEQAPAPELFDLPEQRNLKYTHSGEAPKQYEAFFTPRTAQSKGPSAPEPDWDSYEKTLALLHELDEAETEAAEVRKQEVPEATTIPETAAVQPKFDFTEFPPEVFAREDGAGDAEHIPPVKAQSPRPSLADLPPEVFAQPEPAKTWPPQPDKVDLPQAPDIGSLPPEVFAQEPEPPTAAAEPPAAPQAYTAPVPEEARITPPELFTRPERRDAPKEATAPQEYHAPAAAPKPQKPSVQVYGRTVTPKPMDAQQVVYLEPEAVPPTQPQHTAVQLTHVPEKKRAPIARVPWGAVLKVFSALLAVFLLGGGILLAIYGNRPEKKLFSYSFVSARTTLMEQNDQTKVKGLKGGFRSSALLVVKEVSPAQLDANRDIIAVRANNADGTLFISRYLRQEKRAEDQALMLVTRSDLSEQEDPPHLAKNLAGKKVLAIPLVGALLDQMQQGMPYSLVFLIASLGAIVVLVLFIQGVRQEPERKPEEAKESCNA